MPAFIAWTLLEQALKRRDLAFEKHVLGFYVAKLAETPEETLRLHYWPTTFATEGPNWPIHTHRWELESLVLRGYVKNFVYAFNASEPKARLYDVVYAGKNSSRHPTDRVGNVLLKSEQVYGPGQSYCVPVDTFHSTSVVQAPAITVVRTGLPVVQATVVGDMHHVDPTRYEPVQAPREVQDKIAKELAQLIAHARGEPFRTALYDPETTSTP